MLEERVKRMEGGFYGMGRVGTFNFYMGYKFFFLNLVFFKFLFMCMYSFEKIK